ncbi:TRAP transporter small permease subunit [Oceanibacterium hippocampi]|uniref:TRAP transporter small permease protein n=1 Tax=Oceanibacterium hippocampi TaxID=745714 RepID=A0A1Y5TWU4_9PROT|nr:TRAP transporter small permease [Oceanibacterium hippocampi]SLN75650.1 Tripartite ATP-independent periplasmic transporters, DctQ component [Oceanibacterium hippocampi]
MTERSTQAARPVLDVLRAVSSALLLAGGLLMVVATVAIIVEIAMRQMFNASLGGVDELAGFALAVGTSWSFGSVLFDKAHVRIDTLYRRMGERNRALFDIVGLVGTAIFAGTLLIFAVEVVQSSMRFGATSQSSLAIPVALPQALWLGGLAWFLVVTLALLVASLNAVRKRNWREVGQIAGTRGLNDEIRAELEDSGSRLGDLQRETGK